MKHFIWIAWLASLPISLSPVLRPKPNKAGIAGIAALYIAALVLLILVWPVLD